MCPFCTNFFTLSIDFMMALQAPCQVDAWRPVRHSQYVGVRHEASCGGSPAKLGGNPGRHLDLERGLQEQIPSEGKQVHKPSIVFKRRVVPQKEITNKLCNLWQLRNLTLCRRGRVMLYVSTPISSLKGVRDSNPDSCRHQLISSYSLSCLNLA